MSQNLHKKACSAWFKKFSCCALTCKTLGSSGTTPQHTGPWRWIPPSAARASLPRTAWARWGSSGLQSCHPPSPEWPWVRAWCGSEPTNHKINHFINKSCLLKKQSLLATRCYATFEFLDFGHKSLSYFFGIEYTLYFLFCFRMIPGWGPSWTSWPGWCAPRPGPWCPTPAPGSTSCTARRPSSASVCEWSCWRWWSGCCNHTACPLRQMWTWQRRWIA